MTLRPVNYQLELDGEKVTTPMPFDMTEKLSLYIELKYGITSSIVRCQEDSDSYWIVGRFVKEGNGYDSLNDPDNETGVWNE
jgi:hypothetical protein